ncbi:MAG: Peptidyl-prolyl cis-trans isomerase A [Promethearchaeota archaeon]|jgi:peptidyl-prolyl cis-trans isomerase B (cyclophilin B)|nr:MAG: Peptidyl-prolyl cis-trans isomerase A [Candidatus Lokiarchaeota archaeon]
MTEIKIVTEKGDINIQLFDDNAPKTIASFLYLANQGFYDGITFHRVIDEFMIQGGDPTGTGRGGPSSKGIESFPYQGEQISYPFEDEFQSGKEFDKPGILAMANAGPNTNGSQFFITHVPTPWLNDKHTIFGEIKSQKDQEIVDSIEQGDKIKEIQIL